MPIASSPDHDVFYSRFNRALAIAVWAICVLGAISLFLVPAGPQLYYLVPAGFTVLLVWEVLWVPDVEVSDVAITLRNPLRSIVIPWAALVHVDTKYSLTLHTPGRKFAAWAAPAPGRGTVQRASRSEASRGRVPFLTGAPRPGDLPGSESGEAAQLVRSRWNRLQGANLIEEGVAEQTPIRIDWHWIPCAGIVVLAAGSIAAVLLA